MATQTKTSDANRRRSRRMKTRGTVKVECRRGAIGLGRNLVQEVLDCSDTGIRMTLAEPLDVPTEVEILFTGYGMAKPIKRLGNVRWQLKLESGVFCVGIEFQKALPYRDWQNVAVPG